MTGELVFEQRNVNVMIGSCVIFFGRGLPSTTIVEGSSRVSTFVGVCLYVRVRLRMCMRTCLFSHRGRSLFNKLYKKCEKHWEFQLYDLLFALSPRRGCNSGPPGAPPGQLYDLCFVVSLKRE